jgi:large subunit ribosomal protein L34e
MPKPSRRSRTFRRVFNKTATKTSIMYKRRKPSKAVCGICKKQLQGVLRDLPFKIRNSPKTSKRPERPYGGVLCSACARRLLTKKARETLKNG